MLASSGVDAGDSIAVSRVCPTAIDPRSTGAWRFKAPPLLAGCIAQKDAVTLDGASLTVNPVDARCFELKLVPHTREVTTPSRLEPGDRVNLEVDRTARYI